MLNTKRSAHEEHRKKDLRQPAKLRAFLGQAPNRSPRHAARADQPLNLSAGPITERLLLRRPPGPAEGQERHPLFYAKVPPLPPHEEDQQGTDAAVLFPEARRHLEPHHQDRVPPVAPALWIRERPQRQAAPVPAAGRAKSAASSQGLKPAFRQTRF